MHSSVTKRNRWIGLAISLFLLVLGSKLWVLDRYGSDVLCWDQWDGDLLHVFIPHFEGRLGFSDFYRNHNEHRIIFTKLINLALLKIGGQWDSRVQCVHNAFLHTFFAVAGFVVIQRFLKGAWVGAAAIGFALFFALPISRQNILGGFHSQQYLLIWFAVGAIYLLCSSQTYSLGWWTGIAVVALANFTMASGVLAACTMIALLGLRCIFRQLPWKAALPTFAGCLLAVGIGAITAVQIEGTQWMRAQTLTEFVYGLAHCLQWPNYGLPWRERPNDGSPWVALIIYAPFFLFLARALRTKTEDAATENLLIGVGLWVLLQSVATSYARNVNAAWPASRYMDTLSVGVLLNGILFAFLFRSTIAQRGGVRRLLVALCAAWMLVVGHGVWSHTKILLEVELPDNRQELRDYEATMRSYLMTNDPAQFEGKRVPYVAGGHLVERLQSPQVRAILPASIRPPLALDFKAEPAGSFKASVDTPGLIPLEIEKPFTSFPHSETGTFESALFIPRWDGYLRFKVASSQPNPAATLSLRHEQGYFIDESTGDAFQGGKWRSLYLSTDKVTQIIVAKDNSPQNWIAFTGPVEMSALSFWALRLVQSGWVLALLGIILLLPLALAQVWPTPASRGPTERQSE